MNIGDKIILNNTIALQNLKGSILSSIPSTTSLKTFLVKVFFKKPLFLTVEESKFTRITKTGKVLLTESYCKEEGVGGRIVDVLRFGRYLCEFDASFCNMVLKAREITKWEPEKGVFALLDVVRLKEDFPQYNLKKGAEGTIILVFFKPSLAYDIEFYLGEKANPEWDSFTFSPHHLEFVRSLSSTLQN